MLVSNFWILCNKKTLINIQNVQEVGSLQNWERLFYPNKTGQISTKEGCIDCMEKKCSYSYIHSCGANRRTAGIATDIQRDASEICKDATT